MRPCVIIIGPQAVGKMAVGMALREKYNYRLFHNHMTIELVNELYGHLGKTSWELIGQLRHLIFEDVKKRPLDGFVFTYMMDFDSEKEHAHIKELIESFQACDYKVVLLELEADVNTRLERNGSELRLKNKATKRNLTWSNEDLVSSMEKYRLNSRTGEMTYPYYLKINNTHLSPEEVAESVYNYIMTM